MSIEILYTIITYLDFYSMFAFFGFLFFLGLVVLSALIINSRVQKLTYEESFLRGKVPDPTLEGVHSGHAYVVYGANIGWKGKQFIASEERGVNILTGTGQRLASIFTPRYKKFEKQTNGTFTAYEFKTIVGMGIKNPHQPVLRLDYNIDANPSIIRIIQDEIVEIDPGRYLGKIHLQLLPGWFWTVGYFSLQKATEDQVTAPVVDSGVTIAPSVPVAEPEAVPAAPVPSVAPLVVEPVSAALVIPPSLEIPVPHIEAQLSVPLPTPVSAPTQDKKDAV